MAPLISIITPAYYDDYIGQCIESVLNQTFEDWEMLIIDDGSPGKIPDIVANYEDDRIRYFRQRHVGLWQLSKTYNKGLKLAKGKYVAILEGDDYWPPYKLEKQIEAFDDRNVVLSYGKAMLVDERGKELGVLPRISLTREVDLSDPVYQNRPVGRILEKLLFMNVICSQTVICRKDSLVKIGGFKQPPMAEAVDYPTWLELSLVGEFSATNEILGYWRRHGGQATQIMGWHAGAARSFIRIRDRFFKRIPSRIKDELGFGMETLRAKNSEILGSGYLRDGRICLMKRNWREARRNFKVALRMGSFLTNVGALIGFGLSYLEKDLEWVLKLLGLPRLK